MPANFGWQCRLPSFFLSQCFAVADSSTFGTHPSVEILFQCITSLVGMADVVPRAGVMCRLVFFRRLDFRM